MASRAIYSIRWNRSRHPSDDLSFWTCTRDGERIWSQPFGTTKAGFISYVALRLTTMWRQRKLLSQLKVYGKNGRIQFERTYGNDPKRYKG